MKKLISVLLVAIMVMGCLANVAFASADGDGSVSGSYKTAKAGDTVTVSFSGSGFEYVSYWFELTYDANALEIVEISRGGATAGNFQANTGTGRIAAAADANASANGTLFSVTFKVTDAAKVGDKYNVGLKVLEIRKQGGESVSPSVGAGVVEIVCDHKYDAGVVTKEPTCSEEGVMTYTCELCGATKTEAIAKLAHKAGTDWAYDDDNHWHICTVCGEKVDVAKHEYTKKVVDKEATETVDGYGHWECVCGKHGKTFNLPAGMDDVPETGDITRLVTIYTVAALVVLCAIVTLVFKRKKTN